MDDRTPGGSFTAELAVELDAILRHALDVTAGVGCLAGCVAAVADSGHECHAPIGIVRDANGRELEVALTRAYLGGVASAPYVTVIAWTYVRRDARGRVRAQRDTPASGFRRTADPSGCGCGLALSGAAAQELAALLAVAHEQCAAATR